VPDYISVPLETDPNILAQLMYDYLQSQIPGWVPNEGNLETIIIDANARQAAELRDVASRVPRTIFRYFGKLVGVLSIEATKGTATTTWTMVDSAGYTISAGTQVGIRTAGDELIAFEVLADVTVPPGSTVTAAGAVTIIAVESGANGSGLGAPAGPVELITPLDYVSTIVQVAVTTGGVDAEEDEEYLSRLSDKLSLLGNALVLPVDFAAAARTVTGVERAVALDGYNPDANELQTVDVDATGGTFTLTFTGQTTGAIAWNATNAAIVAALGALSNIAPGDVIAAGGPSPAVVTIEFAGVYDGTNVAQMTGSGALLTGGAGTVTIITTRQGSPRNNNERMVAIAAIDEVGDAVSAPIKADIDTYLQENREVNFIVNVMDPTYTDIDVTYTVVAAEGFTALDVETRVTAALESYLSPANWGKPDQGTLFGSQSDWLNKTVVRFWEIVQTISQIVGVDYIEAGQLTIGKNGGAQSTSDITLTGAVTLPQPGIIVGTVN